MRDIVRGIWPSMLLDPVGVPRTSWRWTQGAPPSRRPWALLLNRFTVRKEKKGQAQQLSVGIILVSIVDSSRSLLKGSTAQAWGLRMKKLTGGRLHGRFLAASRDRLRQLARTLKVQLFLAIDRRLHEHDSHRFRNSPSFMRWPYAEHQQDTFTATQ